MTKYRACKITAVDKRRDGRTRYWCTVHKADATAKYGRPAESCQRAHIPPLKPSETLTLELNKYPGGVAIWGAVAPIYNTTKCFVDRGVHVHARYVPGGKKEIDKTYRSVQLTSNQQKNYPISGTDAVNYMISTIFGASIKYLECSLCGEAHLDEDWFSLHPHRRHLCSSCGRQFTDTERSIGNPLTGLRKTFNLQSSTIVPAKQNLNICQYDYPGGVQIWGSHPAIFWTASEKEQSGIHIHAYSLKNSKPEIDETFSSVTLDGITLDAKMVRVLMAQQALPYLAERIVHLSCPQCGEEHFDEGTNAFSPHVIHRCLACSYEFKSKGRLRKVVGNPLIGKLAQLKKYSADNFTVKTT